MTPLPEDRPPGSSLADERRNGDGSRPIPSPPDAPRSELDVRIEHAFRDVLKKAIAWRMTTDRADPAEVEHAARSLHAAVVEYESAIEGWSAGDAHPG